MAITQITSRNTKQKEKKMEGMTFTEIIEDLGVERDSVLWGNLRTEYQYHLDHPGRLWGFVWHAHFGLGDNPPYDLPLE